MRTYVFVRKDLSDPQKVVQASHLALESGLTFGRPSDGSIHPSIIVLSVERLEFDRIKNYLEKKNIRFVDFYENDIEDLTGVATEPLTTHQGRYLRHYKLMKERDFDSYQKGYEKLLDESNLTEAVFEASAWANAGGHKEFSHYWRAMFVDKFKDKIKILSGAL